MELQKLVEAIALRDSVAAGRLSRQEIRVRVRAVWAEGNWSPSQIAALVGYSPAGIRAMLAGAPGPTERPEGGTLHAETLDLALAFHGALVPDQQRRLMEACIKTGTSVRLLSRILDRPVSTIGYRKHLLTRKDRP